MATMAWAEVGDTFTVGKLTYKVTDENSTPGDVTLTGYFSEPEGALTIPESVTNSANNKEYFVTVIGQEAFDWCMELTAVSIPAYVTSIDEKAFFACNNIETVTFAEAGYNGSLEIGSSAFSGAGMASISLPARLTYINDYAFSGSSLQTITFGEGSHLIYIDDFAFSNCPYLSSINIPASVMTIGNSAFYNCSSLQTVTFTENSALQTIYDEAFRLCTSLTSITIPASVTEIHESAFVDCKLSTLTFAEGSELEVIHENAFYGCPIKSLNIPASVTTIDDWAFTSCSKLTTLTFATGSKLDYIGTNAFSSSGLTSVTIPAEVTYIGDNCFANCADLATLIFADGSKLSDIPDKCFYTCGSLTSVNIPASVETIGQDAFRQCFSLGTVILNNNAFFGGNAFYGIKSGATMTMNLPANLADGAYWTTFYNSNYAFQADENTQVFKVALSREAELTLNEVSDRIVDNSMPVLLKSTGTPPVLTMTSASSSDTQTNNLWGTSSAITNPGNAYVLSYKASGGVGFYKLSESGTIGFGKAYLRYSGDAGVREFFGFGNDDTDAVVSPLGKTEEGAVFNLAGQRLQQMQKGINIVNGRKVIIK